MTVIPLFNFYDLRAPVQPQCSEDQYDFVASKEL